MKAILRPTGRVCSRRSAAVGTITAACGLRATDILSPVEAFEPIIKDAVLTLPPLALVRIRCTGANGANASDNKESPC